MNPITLGERTDSYTTMGKHSKLINISEKVPLININPNNIQLAQELEIPFKEIHLQVDEKMIIISGENFKYQFPTEYLLLMWNRTKKIKDLK